MNEPVGSRTVFPATVESWDEVNGARLIRDDGTTVAASAEAVRAGGFRFVRSGQRVHAQVDGSGTIAIITLPVS